jgi:hypothetical protein
MRPIQAHIKKKPRTLQSVAFLKAKKLTSFRQFQQQERLDQQALREQEQLDQQVPPQEREQLAWLQLAEQTQEQTPLFYRKQLRSGQAKPQLTKHFSFLFILYR